MALDQAVVDNVKMAEYISTVDNRVTNKTALSSYSVPLASHMGKILNATRDFVKVYQYAKNKWGMVLYQSKVVVLWEV